MPFKFNPFTSTLDYYKNGSAPGGGITSLVDDVSATGPGVTSATVNSVGGASAADVATSVDDTQAATNANTPDTIVKRDGTGSVIVGQLIDAGLTANTVPYANSSKQLTSSAVTPTELGYVSGVTSPIQGQLTGNINHIEIFTLNGTDITNKFITLSVAPTTINKTVLLIREAPSQFYGDDYIVNTNQLGWNGLSLDGVLSSGDKLTVIYK